MHPLVKLAKEAVEKYITTGTVVSPPVNPSKELNEKAGVFVCLKKHGELRGCIGTILPTKENMAVETIRNAVSAATEDHRFYPVTADELDEIEYSVDVLTRPEKVEDIGGLDPKKYGVIVSIGRRKGVLLPDLEGVDTIDEQLRIAMAKAGISPDEEGVVVERFEVKRLK